jgi:peroxiredoxin
MVCIGMMLLISPRLVASSEVGKTAPVFELKDLDGKKVSLSDFKGKVILLNFWATWCAPCKAEMPSLENLYRSFREKGLVVIGISVDNSEKTVQSFVKEKAITFPILLDKGKEVSFDDYGVIGLPVTFLIDQKGIIVEKVFGEKRWDSEEVKMKIKRLLEGR